MLPTLPNYLRWEYRVLDVTPGQPVIISGVPVDPTCPHGQLANISLWPGSDGGYAVPVVGSLILIEFHDGNPQKPAVCGLDPSVPPILTTLGGGTSPIALGPLVDAQFQAVAATLASGTCAVAPGPVVFSVPFAPTPVDSLKVVSG